MFNDAINDGLHPGPNPFANLRLEQSRGRKDLIATATRRAQAGLDASHSGLEISSLELTRLAPPAALAGDFDAVQSAFIEAETKRKNAEAWRTPLEARA